jgi:hypothetical protein
LALLPSPSEDETSSDGSIIWSEAIRFHIKKLSNIRTKTMSVLDIHPWEKWMTFCLFIYDLFNGTICISDCTVSNAMVISELERITSPTAGPLINTVHVP